MQHAMSNHSRMDAWIVESGAASYVYQSIRICGVKTFLKVTLGDGYEVDAKL